MKPADVSGKTSATVSPPVTPPSAPVKVPGDTGYVAPPANIQDTNNAPVVVPGTDGTPPQFGIVTGSGDIVKPGADGKPSDEVIGKVEGGDPAPLPPSGGGDSGNPSPAPGNEQLYGKVGTTVQTGPQIAGTANADTIITGTQTTEVTGAGDIDTITLNSAAKETVIVSAARVESTDIAGSMARLGIDA